MADTQATAMGSTLKSDPTRTLWKRSIVLKDLFAVPFCCCVPVSWGFCDSREEYRRRTDKTARFYRRSHSPGVDGIQTSLLRHNNQNKYKCKSLIPLMYLYRRSHSPTVDRNTNITLKTLQMVPWKQIQFFSEGLAHRGCRQKYRQTINDDIKTISLGH